MRHNQILIFRITNSGLFNDRYEPQKRIGTGSYGIVYKCFDTETGTIVAIKKWKDSDKDLSIKKMAQQEINVFKVALLGLT